MPTILSAKTGNGARTRYHFVVFCFLTLLAAFTGLRLALFLKFGPAGAAPSELGTTFLIGLHRDV